MAVGEMRSRTTRMKRRHGEVNEEGQTAETTAMTMTMVMAMTMAMMTAGDRDVSRQLQHHDQQTCLRKQLPPTTAVAVLKLIEVIMHGGVPKTAADAGCQASLIWQHRRLPVHQRADQA